MSPFLHEIEDLLDGPLVDELADAHLLGGRRRDHDQGVVGFDAQAVDPETFAVVSLLLDVFDDAEALIGIDDLISNLKVFMKRLL